VSRPTAREIVNDANKQVNFADEINTLGVNAPAYNNPPVVDTGNPGSNMFVYDVIVTYSYQQDGIVKTDTARFDLTSSLKKSRDELFAEAVDMLARGETTYDPSGLPVNYAVMEDKFYLMRAYRVE